MARHEDTQDVGWRLFCLCKMCEAKGQLLSFTGMLKVSINSYIYLGWLVEVERKHVFANIILKLAVLMFRPYLDACLHSGFFCKWIDHSRLATSLTFRQIITITLHFHYDSCDDHRSSTE